jgi:hypothetical protein
MLGAGAERLPGQMYESTVWWDTVGVMTKCIAREQMTLSLPSTPTVLRGTARIMPRRVAFLRATKNLLHMLYKRQVSLFSHCKSIPPHEIIVLPSRIG